MKKKVADIKNVARREADFSTLAKIEGKGAKVRLKKDKARGYTESEKDDRFEVRVDEQFAKLRRKKADVEKRKLK